MSKLEIVARTASGEVQIWTTPLDKRLVVVAPMDGPRPTLNTTAVELVIQTLADQGLLRMHQRRIHIHIDKKWHLLTNVAASRILFNKVLSIVTLLGDGDFQSLWDDGNHDASTTREFLAGKRGVRDWNEIPSELAASCVSEQSRPGLPEAAGVVRHPFYGEPVEPWLADRHEILPATDGEFKHLKALFSGLDLDHPSHTALYSYLLASFHAASLSCPRPILLVDSWYQGRGKSEVCSAISRLLDNNEHAVSARRDSERFADEMVSILRNARSLCLDNVDGFAEYNVPLLAMGSTGTMEVRHKYDGNSTSYQGVLASMNLVLGSATFHRDMITRFSRVELSGIPQALDPQPRNFAQRYRKVIISEILQALSESTPLPYQSRFATFDGIGLGAYTHVFNEEDWVAEGHLDASRSSVWVYLPAVWETFVGQYRSVIPHLNDQILKGGKVELPYQAEGARAFGKILLKREGEWQWTSGERKENV